MGRLKATEWVKIVHYDLVSGEMTWLPKKVETKFDKAWNTRYAGKPVGRFFMGYRAFRYMKATYLVHRVAWAVVEGAYPQFGIDHINGVRDDNRWVNLRDVPQADNLKNQCISASNKSGRLGILYRERDKVWTAAIYDAGRQVYLGGYKTREEAVAAREAAEKVLGYHKNHSRPPTLNKGDGPLSAIQ